VKKTTIFFAIFLITFAGYANKTTLKEESLGILDLTSEKMPKVSDDKAIKNTKNPDYWLKDLDCPKLEEAKLEKEEQTEQQNIAMNDNKSILHKIIFYIPNRMLDLADIFSVKLGFGPQASLEIAFTKWFSLGGSYGDNYFVENGYNRQYGGGYHGGYDASAGWANWSRNYTDYTFGYTKPYAITERKGTLIPSPSEKVYKNNTIDFWKIGFHGGWIVNAGIEIHPVAIANFLTGFFFIRLTNTKEI
jgi:hypothetical protein